MTKHPIFFDPKNRRAGHVSRAAWALAVVSSIAGIVFLSSLFIFRSFPETLQTSPSQRYAALNDVAKVPHLLPSVRNLARKAQATKKIYPHSLPLSALSMAKAKGLKPSGERREKPLTIGFYANWDDGSFSSLRNNLHNLDWVVPSWLYLQGELMDLNMTLDQKGLDLIRRQKPGTAILAMVQNSSVAKWDGANLGRLMADPERRRDRLNKIVEFVEENKLQGIVIDFEQIPDDAHKDTLAFLGEVHAAFKQRGSPVAVAAPFDDPHWNYKAYAKQRADDPMLMGYDEHWSDSQPGSNCFTIVVFNPPGGADARSRPRSHDCGHRQLWLRLDRWRRGGRRTDLPGGDPGRARLKAPIALDPTTLNPRYSYLEDGAAHASGFSTR